MANYLDQNPETDVYNLNEPQIVELVKPAYTLLVNDYEGNLKPESINQDYIISEQ